MNAFFDGYVNSKTTLKQLVEQYENALRIKVEKEKHEDSNAFTESFNCATDYDMEKQAQDVYTTFKFREFRTELTCIMYCDRVSLKSDSEILEYQISERIKIGEKKAMHFMQACALCFNSFLDRYIMRRWRKDVTRCHTRVKINYTDWVATPEAQRSAKMQKNFDDIKELANDSDDKCMVVMNWMHNLRRKYANT
ncbi:unnamed protein product [Prunus brigantina]